MGENATSHGEHSWWGEGDVLERVIYLQCPNVVLRSQFLYMSRYGRFDLV